ncbi:MAG: ATP-grasp domain-containing protein [Sciscionella sp.]
MTVQVALVDPFSSGLSLIEAFRERGVEPFHVYQQFLAEAYELDPGPGGKLLHENFSATCTALKEYGAEAVLAASETGVGLADELAAALGLPHNVPELAAARTSKLEEARALQAAGVPFARTEEICGQDDLRRVLGLFDRFPVVVKPVASAGSDGVVICADAEAARRAVEGLLGHRNAVGAVNDSVLLQEHLDGQQYILNTVTVDGQHVISDVLVSRFDEVDGKPIFRHKISRRELDATDRTVVDYGLCCLDAVGLVNGAGHTEIRLTDRGPLLIEVNFRLMGPILPADVYVPALGHSHATLFADAVLGRPVFRRHAARGYPVPKKFFAFVFMRAHDSGLVLGMPGLDEVRRLDTFHSFTKLPRLGAEIRNPLMTTGSGGIAYFVSPDAEAILADMDRVHELEDTGRLYSMSG